MHTKIIKKKIIQSMHELNSSSLLVRYTNTQIYVQIQLKIKEHFIDFTSISVYSQSVYVLKLERSKGR